MGATVTYTGPLFDGRAKAAMGDFANEIENDVANYGVDLVRARLDKVLKHPTGYYRSHVTQTDGHINDSNVVYGPWLEGVGSRNKKSRFKGYKTFRLVFQELDDKAGPMAADLLPKYVERMN